jgi:hypothetical protein
LSIVLEFPQEPTNLSHNPLDQVKTSELELNEDTVVEREYEEFEEFDVEITALECTSRGAQQGWGEPDTRLHLLNPSMHWSY